MTTINAGSSIIIAKKAWFLNMNLLYNNNNVLSALLNITMEFKRALRILLETIVNYYTNNNNNNNNNNIINFISVPGLPAGHVRPTNRGH